MLIDIKSSKNCRIFFIKSQKQKIAVIDKLLVVNFLINFLLNFCLEATSSKYYSHVFVPDKMLELENDRKRLNYHEK